MKNLFGKIFKENQLIVKVVKSDGEIIKFEYNIPSEFDKNPLRYLTNITKYIISLPTSYKQIETSCGNIKIKCYKK